MKLKIALLTLLAAVAFSHAVAQEEVLGEAEQMTRRYTEALDSLMTNYYMRQIRYSNSRYDRTASIDNFDAIPDSVIIERLQRLHTTIPLTFNDEVRSYIRMYLKYMSKRLDVMVTLCQYYHPYFEDVLSQYNVPEELKYLTIVESAMNPDATSRAGAAGLWQFMYSTGKRYGLEVNSVVDDRRDTYRSTEAAVRYLNDLYHAFGDWQLAIAAYNCGPGNIKKAQARSGKEDFWGIYPNLPRETRGYIPAFIAVIYVMNYYPEHGLRPEHHSYPIQTDTVGVRSDLLFCYVQEALGMSYDELHTLNPQYRVGYIPALSGSYSLCLPNDRVEDFLRVEDSLYAYSADSLQRKPVKVAPAKQTTGKKKSTGGTRYHTVRKGETLSKIAAKYGISVSTLKKRNGLKSDNIKVGQKLKIK